MQDQLNTPPPSIFFTQWSKFLYLASLISFKKSQNIVSRILFPLKLSIRISINGKIYKLLIRSAKESEYFKCQWTIHNFNENHLLSIKMSYFQCLQNIFAKQTKQIKSCVPFCSFSIFFLHISFLGSLNELFPELCNDDD